MTVPTDPGCPIERLHYVEAESFLEAVAPRNSLWAPEPLAWIFRGHAVAEWALRARAFRDEEKPFEPFGIDATVTASEQAWDVYGTAVLKALRSFQRAVDRAGLVIPTVAPAVDYSVSKFSYASEPRPDAVPLMALAQHFGIPTGLLDWSRHARVAAYFAASEAAADPHSLIGNMCIWALRADFIDAIGHDGVDDVVISLENAPAATNPNLHAQAGLFTWARGEGGHLVPVDEFVARAARKYPAQAPSPPMRMLTVARSCAPKLLRLLSYEGVSASSMFPGFGGVVRAMKEEALWDQRGAPGNW